MDKDLSFVKNVISRTRTTLTELYCTVNHATYHFKKKKRKVIQTPIPNLNTIPIPKTKIELKHGTK